MRTHYYREIPMSKFYEEYEMIRHLAESGTSTEEGMRTLIDHCSLKYPGGIWQKAADIPYSEDTDKITFWLREILQSRTWPENIEAIWFAVCCPEYAKTFDLRMTGSECFITESDGFFEDIIFSESFIPKKQYARSNALKELYRLTDGMDYASDAAAYVLALGFAALSVSEACRRADVTTVPGKNGILHIAAGFETGDMMILNSMNRQQDLQ